MYSKNEPMQVIPEKKKEIQKPKIQFHELINGQNKVEDPNSKVKKKIVMMVKKKVHKNDGYIRPGDIKFEQPQTNQAPMGGFGMTKVPTHLMTIFINKYPEYADNMNTVNFIEAFDVFKKKFIEESKRNDII